MVSDRIGRAVTVSDSQTTEVDYWMVSIGLKQCTVRVLWEWRTQHDVLITCLTVGFLVYLSECVDAIFAMSNNSAVPRGIVFTVHDFTKFPAQCPIFQQYFDTLYLRSTTSNICFTRRYVLHTNKCLIAFFDSTQQISGVFGRLVW